MSRYALFLASALVILAGLTGNAMAQQTITVCDSIPRQTFQDVTLTLPVPQFPYADCHILDADVRLDVYVDGQFFGENTGNCIPPGCSYHDSVYVALALNDLDGTPLDQDYNFVASGLLQSYDGVLDFGGPSGYTIPFSWSAFASYAMQYSSLSIFNSPVNVAIHSTAFSQLVNPGNGAYGVATYITAKVCATYTYECVVAAEPTTWGRVKQLYRR
jgi:hypothetical protein